MTAPPVSGRGGASGPETIPVEFIRFTGGTAAHSGSVGAGSKACSGFRTIAPAVGPFAFRSSLRSSSLEAARHELCGCREDGDRRLEDSVLFDQRQPQHRRSLTGG